MTEKIKELKNYIISEKYLESRKHFPAEEDWKSREIKGIDRRSLMKRRKARMCWLLKNEKPSFIPGMDFVFMRTIVNECCIVNIKEREILEKQYYLHEKGEVCNISPDYTEILAKGFREIERKTEKSRQDFMKEEESNKPGDLAEEKIEYAEALLEIIDCIYLFVEKYAEAMERGMMAGRAEALRRIVRFGAESFFEALQLLRLLHYLTWLEGEYHIGFGRFDQYMYPYFQKDIRSGKLTEEEALELVEEFFLACNIDSDLYPGVQQGDNGQSLMLGGINADGGDAYNELSALCLRASRELKLIDPKINLRVGKKTGIAQYEEGTRLTKAGLGFPQYSNDDVVIPALLRWGYAPEDARDYTVAACWEFIIPGKGMDIPNIGAVSFPKIVNRCVEKYLKTVENIAEFQQKIKEELHAELEEITKDVNRVFMFPAPYLSMMMHGCVEKLEDISQGCIYNNYGLHGTGVSCSADSLYALEKYYFEDRQIEADELIQAIQDDFDEKSVYLKTVREKMPHMGDGNYDVDRYAVWLLDLFADELEGRKNDRGGIYRAGTGSAMYYVRHAQEIGASPDGRRKGEFFPANYSPGLHVKTKGPLSVIKSFLAPDLKKTANGGPLTLEFHDSVFRGEDGIRKVAMLVQLFVRNGGHQLQLNAINAETLKDAQKHPENYRNLIVRVWGWSAYFVELDPVYQDHLIRRAEYTV